jgi:hypothetical protein
MSEKIEMDQDGLVIYKYLNDDARLRWGYRIYEDKTKKVLSYESAGHLSKGGAFLAMTKTLKKLKNED